MSDAGKFMELFRGRTDAWGSVEGRSNKEPVSIKNYENHLAGKTSLGAYMLLDDSTCWFFAIDMDDGDIDKAMAIRQAFIDVGVSVYVAKSKSKGYHCYGFTEEPVEAKHLRLLCHGILNQLDTSAEVFPKQEKLDKTTPLGNYINLPCFGDTRPFLTSKKTAIPNNEAFAQIKRITKDAILNALTNIAPTITPTTKVQPVQPVKTKKTSKNNKAYPPCIDALLSGVSQGGRDVAAFALARFYLDEQYTFPEIMGLLQIWDCKNDPPLDNDSILTNKLKSASKGYSFGCSSIKSEPLLQHFCVGEVNCKWIQSIRDDKKKKGLIREQSFHETETHLYEQIMLKAQAAFLCFEKSTKAISYVESIDYASFTILPIISAEITEGAVILPTGVEPYTSTVELKNEIVTFISHYVDINQTDLEFCAWYILLSWVFDRLNTISYLRFLGDTGTGKSRALDVVGRLCYKPLMMAGAATPAPIYRLIRRFRGTLILEEADFTDSSEKSEIVTILNCGFERNRPVIRCGHDNPDHLEILPCFGPKVFATRYSFQDVALEARCMSFAMEETDREDIPPLLGRKFYKASEILRNKLLLWRLEIYCSIDPDVVEEIDLGRLEPRLKQIGLPYAIPFKDFPDVMAEFRNFMQKRQAYIIQERAESDDGKIIIAIFKLAQSVGKEYIAPSSISKLLSEDFKMEKTAASIGRTLNSMHITRSNKRVPGGRARYISWSNKLMRKLMRRYIQDPEDYADLFEDEDFEGELDIEI